MRIRIFLLYLFLIVNTGNIFFLPQTKLVATHYHVDHYGGIPELSRLVTIKQFYDHGKMTSLAEDAKFSERYAAYQEAAKGGTTALKPGDTIPSTSPQRTALRRAKCASGIYSQP